MMNFCDFHEGYCDKVINIIEFKKNEITEYNLCIECLSYHLGTTDIDSISVKDLKSLINECPKCGLNAQDLNKNKILCDECYIHFKINTKEDKLKLLKDKINYAIKIEDYESASVFKKEIDKIT